MPGKKRTVGSAQTMAKRGEKRSGFPNLPVFAVIHFTRPGAKSCFGDQIGALDFDYKVCVCYIFGRMCLMVLLFSCFETVCFAL
jgi:hypothetical protein